MRVPPLAGEQRAEQRLGTVATEDVGGVGGRVLQLARPAARAPCRPRRGAGARRRCACPARAPPGERACPGRRSSAARPTRSGRRRHPAPPAAPSEPPSAAPTCSTPAATRPAARNSCPHSRASNPTPRADRGADALRLRASRRARRARTRAAPARSAGGARASGRSTSASCLALISTLTPALSTNSSSSRSSVIVGMGLRQRLVEVLFELRGGHHVQLARKREHHTPGLVPAIDRKLGRDGLHCNRRSVDAADGCDDGSPFAVGHIVTQAAPG